MAAATTLPLTLPAAAQASPFDPFGTLRLLPEPHLQLNATQSNNWFGYDQGILERGQMFNSISARWTVPAASAHITGQPENSATWVGIGGGCVDSGCVIRDPTGLIQAGTEQDTSASGVGTYYAWWEIVPLPADPIAMTVKPGDQIESAIASTGLVAWEITVSNLTRGESFSISVLYPSAHLSAEWIEETPLLISTSQLGIAKLPNLTEIRFSDATVNDHPADLIPSEEIQLSDGTRTIAAPSAPSASGGSFGACAWASTCPVPAVRVEHGGRHRHAHARA
jgi:hypothetical protein